jgi:hypothetical protein
MNDLKLSHLVFISPQYSSKEVNSHVYWFVRALDAAATETNDVFTKVLPAGETEAGETTLHHTALQRRRLTLFPWLRVYEDMRVIAKLTANKDYEETLIHFYDGGFRELLLVCLLLNKDRDAAASINFTLLEPWLKVFATPRLRSKILSTVLKRMVYNFGGRLSIYSDTEELGRTLFAGNLAFREYPLFSFLPSPSRLKYPSNERNVMLASPSNSSELDFFLDAVERLEWSNERITKVILKWGFSASKEQLLRMKELLVEVVPTQLSTSDYVALLEQARVYVLPYLDRDYFKYQSSGRLLDGASYRSEMIVPSNTTLARMAIRQGWGSCFEGSDSFSLAQAIEKSWSKEIYGGSEPILASSTIKMLFKDAFTERFQTRAVALKFQALFLILSCIPLTLGPRFLAGAVLAMLGASPTLLSRLSKRTKTRKSS